MDNTGSHSLEQQPQGWPNPLPERPGGDAHAVDAQPGDGVLPDTMPAMAVSNAREEARQQRIAELAYKLAEENGFPEGMELEHWLEAERRLAES
jgi:hypothetical protein